MSSRHSEGPSGDEGSIDFSSDGMSPRPCIISWAARNRGSVASVASSGGGVGCDASHTRRVRTAGSWARR